MSRKFEKRYVRAVNRNIENMDVNPYASMDLWEAKCRLGVRENDTQFDQDISLKLFDLRTEYDRFSCNV
jgi:hypothetical protein